MRVTLIEADGRLARTFTRLLERAGHDVHRTGCTCDPETELHPGSFDLLIVDADSCPSAQRVLRELCQRRPPDNVILLTRGAHDPAADIPPFAVLRKPVTKADLLRAVQRAARPEPPLPTR